jgi:superfamily II DNA or RNA helicase
MDIRIEKYDEVYIKVYCEPGVAYEVGEYFTFDVPGAKYMPAFKNKVWDGKVRLYNPMSQTLYCGLLPYVERFCRERNYEIEYLDDFSNEEYSMLEAKQFISELNLTLEPRDYQIKAFVYAVRNRRTLLISPTASGKSLIIYLLTRYYNARTLIIVPTTSLVSQLASDFADYGFQSDEHVHRIYSGQDKQTDKTITISTWQSIYKLPKEFFEQFDVVIGDEAHLFKAKSLTSIMSKLKKCKYKIGFTGTLDGTETNKLVLEGLFGAAKRVVTTSELIDSKYLAAFKIKCLLLKYPEDTCKLIKSFDYQAEIDWIVRCPQRNNFIKNLALSLTGNTLLLFQFVEKHGDVLYDLIKKSTDRNVYFVSGRVEGDEREQIRKIVETEKDAIIVASSGTFSTGVNIRNLHNVIFSSPSKSRVRNLQSIGRVLRRSETKTDAVLYDIADDFSIKSWRNHTLNHFIERTKIYNDEKFKFKVYPVNLKV